MSTLEFVVKIAPYVIELVVLLEKAVSGTNKGPVRKELAMAALQAADIEHPEVASKMIDAVVQIKNKEKE